MFKTFYLHHSNMSEFDEYLGKIVEQGYEPLFIRELYHYGVPGYSKSSIEVFVTARKRS